AKLRLAAQKGLQAQGFLLTPDSDLEVALAGEPQLKSCHTEQCRERLGRLLDAQVVARYRIKTHLLPGNKNPGWHLNAEILDVEVGALGAGLTEDCADCTVGQAADQLSDMIRRAVLQSAARPRGVLDVATEPPGASVFVDGSELGITPYKRPAFVGKHKLVLRHTGYRSQQAEVEVDETQRRRTELKLAPGTDAVPVLVVEKQKPPVYKKWWFWVAIGGAAVAAGAITAGVVLGTQARERTLPPNTYMFPF
ncbi:MAG TPA: PEGA domain-containing protein, partial [Pseudomonadota bacterium]|nr:PEGA domain-containing protein [Pseudomonadota bacterium]